MPRETVLVLAILFSMVGFWYFKSTPPKLEPVEIAVPLLSAATPAKKTTPNTQEIQRTQAEKELTALQLQFDQESQKLEAQKRALEQLRQRYQSALGTASYNSQIKTRDSEIQNLMEILGSYRQAEDDINRAAEVATRNQDSTARVAREQIESSIQILEQEIHNTQNELNYWRNYRNPCVIRD
jgi:hypothetical protein